MSYGSVGRERSACGAEGTERIAWQDFGSPDVMVLLSIAIAGGGGLNLCPWPACLRRLINVT